MIERLHPCPSIADRVRTMPGTPLADSTHRLPLRRMPLLGREREIRDVRAILLREDVPLLSP